jgi:Trypsin-like peptidase domain
MKPLLCRSVLAQGILFLATFASSQSAPLEHRPSGIRYQPTPAVTLSPEPTTPSHASQTRTSSAERNLGPPTKEEITRADKSSAQRFGHNGQYPKRIGVGRTVGVAPMTLRDPEVQCFRELDGTSTWLMTIRSPGAKATRVHLDRFDVGTGFAVAYGDDQNGCPRGRFTGRGPGDRGEFWTDYLSGEVMHIEVNADHAVNLAVDEIMHLDEDPFAAASTGTGLPCHLDVQCYDETIVSPIARDATVRLSFVSGGQPYKCSGTILEDLDDETFVPYLLTAFHCLSTQAEVDTLIARFFWQRATCEGPLPIFSALPTMRGGKLLAANPTDGGNDMTFIRLTGPIPAGAVGAGWSAENIVATIPAYGIHHPNGDYKRVSFYIVDTSIFLPCFAFDAGSDGDYLLATPIAGGTEQGSSGSGLFDSNGRVRGQLLGGCGSGVFDAARCADPLGWRAVYGRFSVSYSIAGAGRWLEIGGTINVDRAYNGAELGTPTEPFNTLTEGYDLAWEDTRIKMKSGAYSDRLTLTKRVTLVSDGGPVTIGQ